MKKENFINAKERLPYDGQPVKIMLSENPLRVVSGMYKEKNFYDITERFIIFPNFWMPDETKKDKQP